MINLDNPYTYENSINPWLMNHKNESALSINGNKITADYLWTLNTKNRIQCLTDVFNYYRTNGFPYERYDNNYLIKQFNKLKKYDINNAINDEGILTLNQIFHLIATQH